MSVTTIIGPLIMNGSFAYFTTDKAPFYFPGIHFLIGAFCMLISLYLIYKVLSRERKEKPELVSVLEGAHTKEKP
jgi:DHA1 family tetracycline resistance protein-like MFS transporter